MNKLKLLPCPFCGGEAEISGGPENWHPTLSDPDSGGDPIAVSCLTCNCEMRSFDEYEEAIAAWNKRTPITEEREPHEKIECICKNCGYFRKKADGEQGWESWCVHDPCENQTLWNETCSKFKVKEEASGGLK